MKPAPRKKSVHSEKRFSAAYSALSSIVSESDWVVFLPYLKKISALKEKFDGNIIAHSYIGIEITVPLADCVGEFDELVSYVRSSTKNRVMFCGSFYLAQSLAVLFPEKEIFVAEPDSFSNFSNSITPEEVKTLRHRYEGAIVVMDVNMPLSLKQAADICCSDIGLGDVIEKSDKNRPLIILPDRNIALSAAARSEREIVTWEGVYAARDRYNPSHVQWCLEQHPNALILAHHGCSSEVLGLAHAAGSSRALMQCIAQTEGRPIYLFDELSVIERAMIMYPQKVYRPQFVYQCHQMKRVTLSKLLAAFNDLERVHVRIDEDAKSLAEKHYIVDFLNKGSSA